VEKYWSGASWVSLSGGGGGVAGPNTSIQYNNGGTQAGSLNFGYNGTNVNIIGGLTISSANSISSGNQFVGAGGVNTSGAIVSGSSINSTLSSAVVAFQAGGGNFQAYGSGIVNGTNFNAASTSATFCSQTFTTFTNQNCNFIVSSTGAIYSASSATNAIQAPNGTVLGNFLTATGGATNAVQASSGGVAAATGFYIGSTQVVNASLQFVGSGGVVTSGGALFGSAATFTGGIITPSGSNSSVYIGLGGNLYIRTLSGASSGVSCSGISNSWIAISTDNYIVVCEGSARYRSALVAY
jgi:hypothetical protein